MISRKIHALPPCGPITAQIEDLMAPAEFARLPDAISALRAEIGRLPVWPWHRDFIDLCLGCIDAEEHIARTLARTGQWTETLYVGEVPGARPHQIVIRHTAAPRHQSP